MHKNLNKDFFINKKYICLIVRDSSYLKKKYPNNDWTYHNHRDSDIELFIDAANYLTKLGYHVIRMGESVQEPLSTNNPMIIDYATNGMRTDFLDIFLGAHCSFCISTGLGYDGIPAIFRRPIVFIGYVPICMIMTSSNKHLSTIKHHYSTTLNRNLSLQEIFDLGLAESFEKKDFDRLNVELKELNPEEIQNVTREMVERLNNNYKETEEEKELQDKFWQKYKSNLKKLGVYDKFHGEIRGQISTSFLKMNKYILN